MNEIPQEPEPGGKSEDIATLYSQAYKQGTRYWDFSASRKEVQGQFRLRIAREHAERSGAGSLPPLPSQSFSPRDSAPQFQPPQELATDLEPPVRSAPSFLSPSPSPSPSGSGSSGVASRAFENVPENTPETAAETKALWTHAGVREMRKATSPMAGHSDPGSMREVQLPRQPMPTRWYALHSVFDPVKPAGETPVASVGFNQQPPTMAVLSLAGGVGKTCLVATLGRALSALGEHVLLADTAACGLLPFYFGSRESKPGIVRTFAPPTSPSSRTETGAPVQVLDLQAERFPRFSSGHDPLVGELVHDGRGVSRILLDVGTSGRETISRLLLLRPAILVPILPDINSLVSLGFLDTLLVNETNLPGHDGAKTETFYLLNQFDGASALHRDVRSILQQRLGDRLLPFVLRYSCAVSEALAEGMTVIDYAPDSIAAEDYRQLAGWLRNFAAPAALGNAGLRWSER
jgi:cellulose synthase operon protein YhjQ